MGAVPGPGVGATTPTTQQSPIIKPPEGQQLAGIQVAKHKDGLLFEPPPPAGSSGPDPSQAGPILTPYGGIYPQPVTPSSYGPQQAENLLYTQSLAMRPVRQTKIISISLESQGNGTQTQQLTELLPFAYLIRDVIFYSTGVGGTSFWTLAWTWNGTDGASVTLNGSTNSIFSSFGISSTQGNISGIYTASPVMPFYGLNIFVPVKNSQLIFNNINNTGAVATFVLGIVIEIYPDTEILP